MPDPSALPESGTLADLPLAAADPADAAALADLVAGRTIDSAAVVRWLGGWQAARDAPRIDSALFPDATRAGAIAGDITHPHAVVWTESALHACRRLRAHLVRLGGESDMRLVAALVANMVALIVEGDHAPGFADVPLLPPLFLRIAVTRDRIAVLGLRWQGSLT